MRAKNRQASSAETVDNPLLKTFHVLRISVAHRCQFAGTFAAIVWLSRSRGTGSLATDVGLVLRPSDWWGVPAGMGLQIAIALITAPLIYRLFPDGPPEPEDDGAEDEPDR